MIPLDSTNQQLELGRIASGASALMLAVSSKALAVALIHAEPMLLENPLNRMTGSGLWGSTPAAVGRRSNRTHPADGGLGDVDIRPSRNLHMTLPGFRAQFVPKSRVPCPFRAHLRFRASACKR